jgi:ElaB/YqjD/DUF883 family membrane-anchored ribosome-binding protein
MASAVNEFKRARRALAEISQPVFDRTLETAGLANKYAHRNTWAMVGVALAAGALIGFLAAKR